MATLQFDGVTKLYPGPTMAVEDLDLDLGDGELLVLLGPSGCGKSTALRMVAGLESVTAGDISLDGERLNDTAPKDRDIAMVFQTYALYPHMTVEQNMGLGLRTAGVSREETRRRVLAAARTLDIVELLDVTPDRLSGGQSQRVAIGRAIVREPKLFLMDEPLSALDAKLRTRMRSELAELLESLSATALYVTHDQVEAMSLADRIAVLNHGHLQQAGTPDELYAQPANVFVAGFVGSPPMNLLPAQIAEQDGGLVAYLGEQTLPIDPANCAQAPALRERCGGDVILDIRPEHLRRPEATATGSRLRGRMVIGEELGAETLAHVELGVRGVVSRMLSEVAAAREDLAVTADDRAELIARLSPGTLPGPGEPIELVVPSATPLRFFDPESGAALPHA